MTSRGRQQPVDAALACHYADDPARRPRCTLTATLRYGSVALCASCNAARSTLGKGQTSVPLPAGLVFDVLGWVATATSRWAPPKPPWPPPSPEPAKPELPGR